jgi:Putative addiction module component
MSNFHIDLNLDFNQVLDIVRQLSPVEKIQLNEFIWENDLEIPTEHKEIVLDRIEESRINPSVMLDWDEVSKTL